MGQKRKVNNNGIRELMARVTWMTTVLVYCLVNLLITAVVENRGMDSIRATIYISVASAFLAFLIAPRLLRTFDRMQQRMNRQNNELRSLHAIDNAISSELKLGTILDVAVRQTTIAVDGEMAFLWLSALDSGRRSESWAFYNISPVLQTMIKTVVAEGTSPFARKTEGPLSFNNLESTWVHDPAASSLKLRNTITVPIKRHDRTIGLLCVGNRMDSMTTAADLSESDTDLLQAIATTVGVALQNAQLYEETERRGEMLRTMVARTGDAIAASSDAPRLMQILADEASRILSCRRVVIYAAEANGDSLIPLALQESNNGPAASSPESAAAMAGLFYRQRLSLNDVLPAISLSTDRSERDGTRGYIPDVRKALGLVGDHWQFLKGPGFVYLLRSRDQRPIGVLCLIEPTDRGLAPETGSFAMALAAQAGVALENAQLSQQARALLARTQGLQQATNKIAAELDSERVLEGVMDSARRLLDADGYVLWEWVDEDNSWRALAAHGLALLRGPNAEPAEHELLNQVLGQRTAVIMGDTAYSSLAHAPARSTTDLVAPDPPRAVRALLSLPLLYAGNATGVMALYYSSERTFLQDDVDLAQSFAHQAANALENARLFTQLRAAYAREKRIAETLQRSLLPPVPERVGEFEFAHVYRAGSKEAEIGGDFFDIFELEPGRFGVVMADVTGKGLTAAVQTAMIKYTLRGFALEDPDSPERVLERVNNVLCDDVSNLDGFVTLFYGVLDIETRLLTYANGGHENPILYDARRNEVRTLEPCDGLALGCLSGTTYESRSIVLEQSQSLLLYTDGVTEARDSNHKFLGVGGLLGMMNMGMVDAQTMVDTLYNKVESYAGDGLRDDIALLLIRRAPSLK